MRFNYSSRRELTRENCHKCFLPCASIGRRWFCHRWVLPSLNLMTDRKKILLKVWKLQWTNDVIAEPEHRYLLIIWLSLRVLSAVVEARLGAKLGLGMEMVMEGTDPLASLLFSKASVRLLWSRINIHNYNMKQQLSSPGLCLYKK